MGSTDLTALERRARWSYELGRVRRALLGLLPLVVIIAACATMTHRPSSTIGFGCAAFVLGVGMLWYGREPQRAVLAGIAAGLVPLVLAMTANHIGHGCMGDRCMRLCVPACTAGGLFAGFAVARVAWRRGFGVRAWMMGSALALATGAMGCVCVGYSGVLGLGAGFVAATAPAAVARIFARRAP